MEIKKVEFAVNNNSIIPDIFTDMENLQQVHEFIKELTAIPVSLPVDRIMTYKEKQGLRGEYQELLESKHPLLEMEYVKALSEHAKAKEALKDAQSLLDANMTEIRAIGKEVKRGVKEIRLESKNTWQIPYEGSYYYFTYIESEKRLTLCKITEIPQDELEDLYVTMNNNNSYIETNFKDQTE